MSKKTKKQKIEAQKRRELKITLPPSYEVTSSSPSPVSTPRKTTSASVKNPPHEISEQEKMIQHYFLKDLRKTFIVVGLLFVLEFFLYFASMMR